MKQIKGPAGSLHINDGGAGGLPVVFVHSFRGDATHWSAQLEHLRQTRRAVAFDARGHGQSDAPAGDDYAVESFAADIAAVVDGLGLERFVLVGHSMGGASALEYAGRHPERVAGLVLVSAPGKLPTEQAQQILKSLQSAYDMTMENYWQQLTTDAQPQVRQKLEASKHQIPKDRALSIIEALFQYDPVPALRSYTGPKLAIVTPQNDQPYELHRLASDVPHQVVTGTSHWIQMDKPDKFNRLLDEFLRSVETKTRLASKP